MFGFWGCLGLLGVWGLRLRGSGFKVKGLRGWVKGLSG